MKATVDVKSSMHDEIVNVLTNLISPHLLLVNYNRVFGSPQNWASLGTSLDFQLDRALSCKLPGVTKTEQTEK